MIKNKTVPIFFSCDDNYMPFLSVAIRSLIDNADSSYEYKIYVLNSGLREENRTRVAKMAQNGFDIEFVDVTGKLKLLGEALHLRDYYTASIYFRIFIPGLFPQYEKAIYLDSDIVVPGDISKLYETELGDRLVGAVSDDIIASRQEYINYAENAIGLPYREYFNSGMMLMNLEGMREAELEETFIYLLNTYHFDTICPDQDYLNALCAGRVLYLDRGWNKMSIDKNYSGEPSIIHYNMFYKPWQYDGIAYGEYFWKYATRVAFFEDILRIRANFSESDADSQRKGELVLRANAQRISESEFTFKNVLCTCKS